MKRIILTVLMAFAISNAFTQNSITEPKVDERTELLSVVFRFEGLQEYFISSPSPFMLDENGFIMKETYYLSFKTRKN